MRAEEQLLKKLEDEYGDYIFLKQTLPKPYYEDIKKVKAILLGCDPSTGREEDEFEYVFNIDKFKVGEIQKYNFNLFYDNLQAIGLDLSDIYAQNLCKNYFKKRTTSNHKWCEIASLWIPIIKDELDSLFPMEIPVLLTAESLLKTLVNSDIKVRKASDYYKEGIIIGESDNKLGRVLIPFFRHYDYKLGKWKDYRESIKFQ